MAPGASHMERRLLETPVLDAHVSAGAAKACRNRRRPNEHLDAHVSAGAAKACHNRRCPNERCHMKSSTKASVLLVESQPAAAAAAAVNGKFRFAATMAAESPVASTQRNTSAVLPPVSAAQRRAAQLSSDGRPPRAAYLSRSSGCNVLRCFAISRISTTAVITTTLPPSLAAASRQSCPEDSHSKVSGTAPPRTATPNALQCLHEPPGRTFLAFRAVALSSSSRSRANSL
eukprot:CAMPEP_0115343214 /NCGR_PEP_ID=MMETSP0270-20121206/92618_1 /TAXON_ID=71861 /ORGANISM="Scrippsiella trochoidea, Strain CCMP3099" /LENGTH=230 /DNA_ID=CAMNT_0002764835 /DNA_START=239 /DNA_END=932 /DNA_ORIENTATION=-